MLNGAASVTQALWGLNRVSGCAAGEGASTARGADVQEGPVHRLSGRPSCHVGKGFAGRGHSFARAA